MTADISGGPGEINAHTKWCGVIGNPVEHSLSPSIHNAAFQDCRLNYVYLAFRVEHIADAIRGIRALGNAGGFSVTIPHKVSVIPHLDDVETTARHIGAVNTIVVRDGKLTGYNTDASGALRALQDAGVELKGRHVIVLGSGGAARAIAFGLATGTEIARLTILGIDEKERRALVNDLQAKTGVPIAQGLLEEQMLREVVPSAEIMIHCTPVGMSPKTHQSCVPVSLLSPRLTVMDIVYNPRETRLLKEAKGAGAKAIPGLDMFLNQALEQFELWTGLQAPASVMRRILESRFS
ncbi:shikimate dehydrogenase [Nitrospira sp.]|nr:shikimate dehydrogenase [Nitrospira sp.]